MKCSLADLLQTHDTNSESPKKPTPPSPSKPSGAKAPARGNVQNRRKLGGKGAVQNVMNSPAMHELAVVKREVSSSAPGSPGGALWLCVCVCES